MAFELITTAPRSQQVALGIALLLVIGGGGGWVVKSKQSEVNQLSAQHATLQGQVMQTRALAAQLARFRQEAAALRERLEAVKERLPTEKEIPQLYRQVSDLAHQSGLAVSLFDPGDPENRDFYEEAPITVIAETSYHSLGEFFARLARLPRVVTLNRFKFQGVDRPPATLRAELTLATYFLTDSDASPPQPGVPAKGEQ